MRDIIKRCKVKATLLIQEAILPYQQKMEELRLDYFVIYRPRDVVSGDFWWINEINGKIYLACVDCTGHGVVGAFMTMIGNALLDKTIIGSCIENPCDILAGLHKEVQTLLRQKTTGNNNGMDMPLICLERGEEYTRVIFAGAKQSLYYVPNNEGVMKELKGDRKAIGGIQSSESTFTNQELYLKNVSWIYMDSDGLYNQNNVLRKRFGENLLKEILLENHYLASYIQKEELEKTLDKHQ